MSKVVLITGASSGLGAGMAREFAERGYDLALCARRTEPMEALKADFPNTRIETATLDVTNHDQVQQVFQDFHARFGHLDRIIVNAGIGRGTQIGRGGHADNLATLETNLIAAMSQAEAAMAIFRAQNAGHLVFISSISAIRGMRGAMNAYATSKAALAHMAEGLQLDVLGKPVNVTTLFPGYIRTEINAHIPKSKTPFIIDEVKGRHLLVNAIEKEPRRAYVPSWPWTPLSLVMKVLPLSVLKRMF